MIGNIALVGLGYWGKNHLKSLHDLGLIRYAYDLDKNLVELRKKEFPDVDFVSTDEEIIENPNIKGVVIAVPASKHYLVAKKFIEAEKDVLVEKPLALNTKDAKDLVETAERNNRILMVGHILRYHPAVLKLEELLKKGHLGEIRYIYSNRLNIGKIRTEENVLWSFSPHDISLILMLVNNQLPSLIEAFGEAYVNKEIYDTIIAVLKFKNYIMAHIFVSWLHPFKEQRLVVVGSENMAVFDDVSNEKLKLFSHRIIYKNGESPEIEKSGYRVIDIENKEPLKEELLHFAYCIEHRITPRTDGIEGLNVLKVLEEAEKSLGQNK